MQIVIDISEEDYKWVCEQNMGFELYRMIANGTPLPKGHGRLIDADSLDISGGFNGMRLSDKPLWIAENIIRCAPTIIEADKGDKE